MCMIAFSRQSQYSALEKVRRQAEDPRSVPCWAYVVITDACSHRCAWCYGGFDAALDRCLSLADYRRLLDNLAALDILQVTLAGGEPTEHPDFRAIVQTTDAHGFLIHVASHGEQIDADLARFMADHHVRQVQLNFQGSRFHDAIHGVRGSYDRQRAAVAHLRSAGIEITTTTVVGRYNLDAIDEIFAEASELGVDRLRIWEATGRGNRWRRNLEAREIFARCQTAARALGYTHTLAYDPEFEGDVSVACPQLSNLYMYVTSAGRLRFCGAVPGGNELEIIDGLTAPPAEIRAAYLRYNAAVLGDRRPWCPARTGMPARPAAARDAFIPLAVLDA